MRRVFNALVSPLFVFVLIALLAAWGCAPKQTVKSTDLLSTPNLLVEADAAWKTKRYAVAELYYGKLLERTDLATNELPVLCARLAESAYMEGHYHEARIALEKWANLNTAAVNDPMWERMYLRTIAALGKTERLQNHLQWLLGTPSVPWAVRADAALWFSHFFMERGDNERALDVLGRFYEQAPDRAARVALEHDFLHRLQGLCDTSVVDLASAVSAENLWRFPYALAGFEHDVRMAADKEKWSAVWHDLRNLSANADLVDLGPLKNTLADLEKSYGLPRLGLILALPLSGPYGKVGVKVLRGAGLAQWRLAQEGVDIDLRVLNTEAQGWDKRLAALPSLYSVVGGPLRIKAFKQLYESVGARELKNRAFFTFLSSLGDLQEGRDAWRFFTSRNDEVRSLVRLAVDELGIKDLAIFYPEEKFGRTMAETFYREAFSLGGQIKGMQSYPSHNLKQWSERVGKLLKVPSNFSENKDVPLQQPDFGAVFLPDGWSQARTLLPNFFFYEGDQLVFLGPGLWSRALDNAKGIDAHYYRLAVCPGAWWEYSDGGRNLQDELTQEGLGQADFWVALGYDFIRFAGKLGTIPAHRDANEVNKRILVAQDIDFSMAPITWGVSGVASQNLFLFSPDHNGKQIVDAAKIAARVVRAKARREKRVEAYEKRMAEEKAKK